jgi:hypothetical protein
VKPFSGGFLTASELRRFIAAVEQLPADSYGADFRWERTVLPLAEIP